MKKITHNADKKNINSMNDLHNEILDYDFSRAQDKEIQTEVFSTNVPNNTFQPLESNSLNYFTDSNIKISDDALKIAVLYKVTNNNIDYISQLNQEDSSVLLDVATRTFQRLKNEGNLASVVNSLDVSDFEKLSEEHILNEPLYKGTKITDINSDYEEITRARPTQDGIYNLNEIDESIMPKGINSIHTKPVSQFPKSEQSLIYNILGIKSGDNNNVPDMTPTGGDVEQNYLETKFDKI